MKTIWRLTYETIPGSGGQQIKEYKSFEEVKKDIKQKISQIHISPYTRAIREEGTHTAYRTAMADFVDHYVFRKDFMSANDPLPSSDPDDYERERKDIPGDCEENADEDDWFDDEDTDELDDFDIYIGKDSLFFECKYEGHPHLYTDMIVMDDETKTYRFEFNVDRAPKSKLKELQMTLTSLQYWGTSSYPLLILRTLEGSKVPLDQRQIQTHIKNVYDTTIERKAIGRNISLLKDLGYDIRHSGGGYYIPKPAPTLAKEDFHALVDSILANDTLADERKRQLIDLLVALE